MIHSPSGVRPTRSPYRQNTPCAQWLPSTCTLTEYDSCVTFNKLYTQPFHTLNIPTPKSEYHSGIVAKRESVSCCSNEFKKKGFIKEYNHLIKFQEKFSLAIHKTCKPNTLKLLWENVLLSTSMKFCIFICISRHDRKSFNLSMALQSCKHV